ncbi:hypothetical protein N7492_005060 [Penicillium capsulatum]|uniref:60S ribosomal protein L36 n=1 Tax=Penicillium capsulatum TaxID=69766 RepID=A0A9W9LQS9_9EURO|nr:hypothetical protein N7492_005060 [Penicillium capsulatum]
MAQERTGIVVGNNSGRKTTPLNTPKNKISRTKGQSSRRTAFVREIAREVVGLAPYERRIIELLRNTQDKRARKLAKKRLGLVFCRLLRMRARAFVEFWDWGVRTTLLAGLFEQLSSIIQPAHKRQSIDRTSDDHYAQFRQHRLTFFQLGTFTRGKRKVEDMQGVIAEARRVQGH